MPRGSIKSKVSLMYTFLLYLLALLASIMALIPFLWMLKTSFQTQTEIMTFPPILLPSKLRWENYIKGLTYLPFSTYFLNSIKVTGMLLIGHILSGSLVGYAFAQLRFPGRNFLFGIMLSTLMIPEAVTLVPLYLFYKKLGWINTFLPLIVPGFLGWPFFVFLLRQFFLGIPRELSDAARIDGCSEIVIWARIMLPLCKPALIAVAIFSVVGSWNDFMHPLIYLQDESKYTVALGLQVLKGLYLIPWNWIMAVSVVVTLPPIILFFMFQRYFIEGVTFTGSKG